MSLPQYLPSAKFTVMVGAVLLSGGLVVGAQYITHAPQSTAQLATADQQAAQAAQAAQWQQALNEVESQSGVTAPQTPDANTVSTLLTAAESPNLTTQVGRTLLINLGDANAQGLGNDTPTQDQLIAQATAQINAVVSTSSYTNANLTLVAQNNASLRAYGNAVMTVLNNYPDANAQNTYTAIGTANDSQNPAALAELKTISTAYKSMTAALVATPVPQTFAPLQLELVNDFAAMASSYPDMETMLTDPLRGLAGVQRYASLLDEAQRVLTSIAQQLSKDGILFSKDEPGATWNAFLSS
jgi:hypothetical protein